MGTGTTITMRNQPAKVNRMTAVMTPPAGMITAGAMPVKVKVMATRNTRVNTAMKATTAAWTII